MLALWMSFLLVVLFSTSAKLIVGDGQYLNMLALFAVVTHVVLSIPILMIQFKEYRKIIVIGFLLRVATMFWDMFARGIAMVPHAGMDDYGYMMGAVDVGKDLSLLGASLYGGLYPKTMGLLVYFTGAGELFVHYLNVLFGISTVLLIYRSLQKLNISEKAMHWTVIIAALFPQNIFFSGTTLREAWITFLVACSMYQFIKWCQNGNLFNAIASTFLICWSAAYHSGVIFILFGYLFGYLFYKREDKKLNFSKQTVAMFMLFLLLGIVTYYKFGDVILGNKFGNVEDLELETIYGRTEFSAGDSGYLQGLEVNSFSTFMLYAPIKILYFIASPMPYNWRGLTDMIAFGLDAVFYIWTLWYFAKHYRLITSKYGMMTALMISIVLVLFVFGVSTGNSGTAIRHRHKIFPLLALVCAAIIETRQSTTKK